MRQFHQLVRFLLIVVMLTLSTSLPLAAQVSFFTPPTYYGSGTVFVGDFNGDGKPDILTNIGTMNLGKGDGTFTVGTTIVGGVLAVGDFNGDGKPDVLQQGTGTLLALLGNGDGTFQPPISTNSGASLSSVIADDLNGDGKADVLGIFYNNLVVYIGNGDGTFAAPTYVFDGGASSLAAADFNGDGNEDLAGTAGSAGLVVLLGNRDGTFQPAVFSYPNSYANFQPPISTAMANPISSLMDLNMLSRDLTYFLATETVPSGHLSVRAMDPASTFFPGLRT